MSRRQLISRYLQLKHQLERAYSNVPWDTKVLDRLTQELSTLERTLATDPRPFAY